jgi:hypothetical protein
MLYLLLIIAFVLGTVNGTIVTRIIQKKRDIKELLVGDLRIDSSENPEQPYMFLELTKSIAHTKNKQYIWLQVNTKPYLEGK